MLGIHDYWLLVATGVLLNLTPGQDTLYILGRSIAQGRRIGLASALGISAGSVVHTLAAALERIRALVRIALSTRALSARSARTLDGRGSGCRIRLPREAAPAGRFATV